MDKFTSSVLPARKIPIPRQILPGCAPISGDFYIAVNHWLKIIPVVESQGILIILRKIQGHLKGQVVLATVIIVIPGGKKICAVGWAYIVRVGQCPGGVQVIWCPVRQTCFEIILKNNFARSQLPARQQIRRWSRGYYIYLGVLGFGLDIFCLKRAGIGAVGKKILSKIVSVDGY